MKTLLLALSLACLLNPAAFAHNTCFLIKENSTLIHREGDCQTRYSPCSTFKIALSLMGYNEGILIDETHPQWNFKKGYPDYIETWKQPQTPHSWVKNSCIWYSQVLTEHLGMKKFKSYLSRFHYGNQDASGDKYQNNGLTHAWLSSSLTISPEEQMQFLQDLIHEQLPISKKAQKMTKAILFLEDLPNGWKLYAKTGSGNLLNETGVRNPNRQHGWFIGYIQKENRIVSFVYHITDQDKQDTYASLRAKANVKQTLLKWIEEDAS